MIRSIAVALCAVFLLAACESKAPEPINPARVATNRENWAKCKTIVPCIGGFVKLRAENKILRIERGEPKGFRIIGLPGLSTYLNFNEDEGFNQIEFVLPDSPEWDKTAIAYEKQFVESK